MFFWKKKSHKYCRECGSPMALVTIVGRSYFDRYTGETVVPEAKVWCCSTLPRAERPKTYLESAVLDQHDGAIQFLSVGGDIYGSA